MRARFDHGRTDRQAFVVDREEQLATVFPNRLVDDDELAELCTDLNENPGEWGRFRWHPAEQAMLNQQGSHSVPVVLPGADAALRRA